MLSRYIRSINDLLARTSHQRTTSEKRTKLLLPKCPLFGGSTVAGNFRMVQIFTCSLHMRNLNFKNFERSKILQRKIVYKILDRLTETRLCKARNRERV